MKNWIAAALFVFIANPIFSQQKDSTALTFFKKTGREKQFGMNMTPLLVQLIPFNRSNPNITGPFAVNFKMTIFVGYCPDQRRMLRTHAGYCH